MKNEDLKFSQKDRIKYLSETFRNVGIALIAGSILAFAVTHADVLASIVTLTAGCVTIWLGYKMMEL